MCMVMSDNGRAYPDPPRKPYRLISFLLFLFMICVVILVVLSSCQASKPLVDTVDYSYTQDSRDSLIARIHHYEVTTKPDRNPRAERTAVLSVFILISLIVFLI